MAQTTQRPNVLLILTDDQGYADVHACGSKDMVTPNMDSLFKDGKRFTNFYANSSVCSPTRAALLSGRYPHCVGVPGVVRTHDQNSWGYFDPNVTTLADKFRTGGYKTAIIGKWHLGLEAPNIPNERGFDHFHGFLGDMMDNYWTHRRHGKNYMRKNKKVIDPKGHATDLFSQWSADYIREQKDADKPFFLYLAYNAPHGPIQPPEEYVEKVRASGRKLSPKREKMVAFIEHLDDGVGKVLEALKETGLDKNTIVVFTSDNGGVTKAGANNGPNRGGKCSMYEGGLRVPGAIRWPDVVAPGSTTAQRVVTMDLYPTLLAAAGITVDHYIEGRSFLPLLQGKSFKTKDRPLFFVRREGGGQCGLTNHAVRMGDWKLVQNSPFRPFELFNMAADPMEEKNALETAEDNAREAQKLMMKFLQEGARVPWQPPRK